MNVFVVRASPVEQDEVERLAQIDPATKEFKYLWRRYHNWDTERTRPIIARAGTGAQLVEPGELVGFHAAAFGKVYVNSYYQLTIPAARGQGVGGEMVTFLLLEANTLGCTRLKFKVPFNSLGQSFWEGFGLRPFGKDAHHYLFDYNIEDITDPRGLAQAEMAIPERDMDRYLLNGIEVLSNA